VATDLSTTEYAVLGVLAEGPNHGFAISKRLAADTDIGRILTVRRPLVYRALDRLVAAGMAQHIATEKGESGPQRVVHEIAGGGRKRLSAWLDEPVDHVREIRIEFLLKLAIARRLDRSPLSLIRVQRKALAPTFDALDGPTPGDHVELWRRHNAAAAAAYLIALEKRYTGVPG